MGHERTPALPRTTRWRKVVEEMVAYDSDQSQVAEIAAHTIANVRDRFRRVHTDPRVLAAFQFLVAVSSASRRQHSRDELASVGIQLPSGLNPFTVTRAAHAWVDSKEGSAEYGYLAKAAAGDAIAAWYQKNQSVQLGLFDSADDPFLVWRKAGSGSGFSELSRLFFARFTERYLNYFLEREASSAIADIDKRELFRRQLEEHVDSVSHHSFETSKITQSFAAGWFNKHARHDIPRPLEIEGFLYIAFGKIREELAREGEE